MAAVNGLAGAINSAAALGYAKSAVTSTCDPGVPGWGNGGVASNTQAEINGATVYFHFGYPVPWDDLDPWKGHGIEALLNLSGFTAGQYTFSGGIASRVFTKDGAPSPASCMVRYATPNAAGGAPTVTPTTGGC